uniref:RNA-dependent RNA polymerase n=1 Tax=Rhizoctonia cerealis duamitovirus TaxID=3068666 RepID=A0AA51BSA8_9VIRU|nr:MAG: RNA-dependent RNA polymerase [Rhizoctonia cerealis duamitovirus]
MGFSFPDRKILHSDKKGEHLAANPKGETLWAAVKLQIPSPQQWGSSNLFIKMITTMILLSALISLVHYVGLETSLVYLVGLPPYYYMVVTAILILLRLIIAVNKYVPSFIRLFRRLESLPYRRNSAMNPNSSPFKNGARRGFSTSNPLSREGGVKSKGGKSDARRRTSISGLNDPSLLVRIRSKFQVVKSMIPLSQKFLGTSKFKTALRLVYYLSLARTTRLAYRANLAMKFLSFVLWYHQHNGASFTIKWLKAGYVAIQKELGQNGMKTLRDINPDLPLPALAGRLPRIIPPQDRVEIRSGVVGTIRFWSSLFNLYRILKIPGEIKLSTITDEFTGQKDLLFLYIKAVGKLPFFNNFRGHPKWATANLSPTKFEISRSASPSNKISCHGLLTDIYSMVKHRLDLYESLHHLAYATHYAQTPFMALIADGYDIISDLVMYQDKDVMGSDGKVYRTNCILKVKPSIETHGSPLEDENLSQFAIKEEAAGKVRVFALLDSLSQTFLRPLHDLLFDILRQIPNDGTFDQDASVLRCKEKAMKAGKAYSFDLTAATDRIPALLSAAVLNALLSNPHIGAIWLKVMTDRTFWFNGKVADKFGVKQGPYRYAVGQPMGGLSSWAMLALTHHWLVQFAAYRAGKNNQTEWFTNYEILGDDLVIFDTQVADEYLLIMADLGCEINLNKSIVSHSRPVFEFAKRTCWGPNTVSGISFNQLMAGVSGGSRLANVLSFAKSGHLTSIPILLSLLTAGAQTSVSALKSKLTQVGVLSLLGSLYNQGKTSLMTLVTALISPKEGLHGDTIGIPTQAVLHYSYERLMDGTLSKDKDPIPWSHSDQREDVFMEHEDFLTVSALLSATKKAENALKDWKKWLRQFSYNLHCPPVRFETNEKPTLVQGHKVYLDRMVGLEESFSVLPSDYQDLVLRATEFAGQALGIGFWSEDPAELVEECRDTLVEFQSGLHWPKTTLEEAMALEARVDSFKDQLYIVEKIDSPDMVVTTTPVLSMVSKLVGGPHGRLARINDPFFQESLLAGGS